MHRLITAHHTLFAAPPGAGDDVPDWVHLVPAGEFRGVDGRGPYRLENADEVIAASGADGMRLPIDENHSIDLAMKQGGSSPARGWIVEMQARADGIWGRVEWTPAGQAMMAAKEYRGISPVFAHAKEGGRVLQVLRAALTNAPNLAQLTTLHHQQKGPTVDLTKLRKKLGLAEDAGEEAILAAVDATQVAASAHAQQLQRIAETAKISNPAQATADTIVTALQTSGAGDAGQLRETVVSLQSQLAALTQAGRKAEAERVVDAAIKELKPIAAMRDHYIARHMADPEAVNKELAAMPSINGGGIVNPPKADGAPVLGHETAGVLSLMGVDPTAFAAEAKRLGVEVN